MNDQDFRTVMTEACLQFHEAVQHWERVEWVNRDQTNEKDRTVVSDAAARMKTAQALMVSVLGNITEISPYDRGSMTVQRLLDDARKRLETVKA